MGWGDEIVAAGQAERLCRQEGKRVAIVGKDQKPRWHPMWDGNPAIARPEEAFDDTTMCVLESGPDCRPYITYPFSEDSGWTFNKNFRCSDNIATIYLSDAEIARGQAARAKYGHYVLIEPYTKHQNFQWPMDRWEQLVSECRDLTFVQHIHRDSLPVKGAKYEQADFREACGLISEADCYVRSESGLCHAAAAMGVTQITLFGGCMDPEVMGGYPRQLVIADKGPGSPCGKWKPCDHCRQCMDRITVEQVARSLRARLRARRAA